MKKLSIFFLLHISLSLLSQNVQFYKENLSFSLTKTEFSVDGLYYFRNNNPDTVKQLLVYPFPQRPGLQDIKNVKANSLHPEVKGSALVNFNDNAATFRLTVFPFDTAIVHISYLQSISGNYAEYILTTTQKWGNPFEKADYTLQLPINLRVDSLSYDADSILITDGYLYYKFHYEDFMPQKNFSVFFSEIPQ